MIKRFELGCEVQFKIIDFGLCEQEFWAGIIPPWFFFMLKVGYLKFMPEVGFFFPVISQLLVLE